MLRCRPQHMKVPNARNAKRMRTCKIRPFRRTGGAGGVLLGPELMQDPDLLGGAYAGTGNEPVWPIPEGETPAWWMPNSNGNASEWQAPTYINVNRINASSIMFQQAVNVEAGKVYRATAVYSQDAVITANPENSLGPPFYRLEMYIEPGGPSTPLNETESTVAATKSQDFTSTATGLLALTARINGQASGDTPLPVVDGQYDFASLREVLNPEAIIRGPFIAPRRGTEFYLRPFTNEVGFDVIGSPPPDVWIPIATVMRDRSIPGRDRTHIQETLNSLRTEVSP